MTLRRPLVVALSCAVLAACATQPPASGPGATPTAAASAPSTDAGQQLNALFERYFEDMLRLSPAARRRTSATTATTTSCRTTIGPEYRAETQGAERSLPRRGAGRSTPARLSPADRISYDIFVRERERTRAAERFPEHLLPINQARQPAHRDAGTGLGHERPAVRHRAGLRELAEAPRRHGRVDGPGHRQHARRRGPGRGAAAPGDGKGAAAARRDDRRAPGGQRLLRAGARRSRTASPAADRERLTAAYAAAIRDEVVPAYRPPARLRARRVPAEDAARRSRGARCPTARRGTRSTRRSTPPRP